MAPLGSATVSEIVNKIIDVRLATLESDPPQLHVHVVGEVPEPGYSDPHLERVVYFVPPSDGIQAYTLSATPPDGPAGGPRPFTVEASDTWTNFRAHAPWLKGVRVGAGGGEKVVMLDD